MPTLPPDSQLLLLEIQNNRIEHIDAVIHAQRPKLKPYKRAMRENLAEALGIDVAAINLKAKTGEGLGPVGEGLAMSAQVIVQLVG